MNDYFGGFKWSISFTVIGTELHSSFEEIIRRLQSCEIKCLQLQLAIVISKYPCQCKGRDVGTKLEFPCFVSQTIKTRKKGQIISTPTRRLHTRELFDILFHDIFSCHDTLNSLYE